MQREASVVSGSQVVEEEEEARRNEVIRLRGQSEESGPHVSWAAGTVDNENSGQRVSNCCCIYKKPRAWDESESDESDEEMETCNCRGHTEVRKRIPSQPGPSTKP